ncbi:MAG TPA: hypothetical protein VNZ86_04300 [Bacteroidia bacterium]|nr:hypothetical protein [Bacteroidia bacterium]
MKKNSRISLFLFVVLIAVGAYFSACRKKEDRAPSLDHPLVTSTNANGATHCFNGVQDGNENGVDCGGDCIPCAAAVPPCSITANTLTMSGVGTSSVTSPAVSTSGGYTFTGNTNYGVITISITGTPDITHAYTVDGINVNASLNDGSVTYGNMSANSGNVNFNFANGKYSATLCSGSFYSYITSNGYTVNASIKP